MSKNINEEEQKEDDEEEYDEDYGEEYGDELEEDDEPMEVLTHCVHRLPLKGQKANLLSYQTLIEIEKEPGNK